MLNKTLIGRSKWRMPQRKDGADGGLDEGGVQDRWDMHADRLMR
jgi:hypothetical protein